MLWVIINCSSQTQHPPFSENNYFSSLVHKLCNEYLYCISLSWLMTKNNSLKFKELENCINSARALHQSRGHLIGIVPSVMIDNKTEMHIVHGYNKDLKSFPLNEENLKWCCSAAFHIF